MKLAPILPLLFIVWGCTRAPAQFESPAAQAARALQAERIAQNHRVNEAWLSPAEMDAYRAILTLEIKALERNSPSVHQQAFGLRQALADQVRKPARQYWVEGLTHQERLLTEAVFQPKAYGTPTFTPPEGP